MTNGEGGETPGGFYKIKGRKVDVSKIDTERLKEIAEETGAEFPIEADPKTGKAVTQPEFVKSLKLDEEELSNLGLVSQSKNEEILLMYLWKRAFQVYEVSRVKGFN